MSFILLQLYKKTTNSVHVVYTNCTFFLYWYSEQCVYTPCTELVVFWCLIFAIGWKFEWFCLKYGIYRTSFRCFSDQKRQQKDENQTLSVIVLTFHCSNSYRVVSSFFWVTEVRPITKYHICKFKTDKTISGCGRNDKLFHLIHFT